MMYAVVDADINHILVDTTNKMHSRRIKRRLVSPGSTLKCASYLMQQHRDNERWVLVTHCMSSVVANTQKTDLVFQISNAKYF